MPRLIARDETLTCHEAGEGAVPLILPDGQVLSRPCDDPFGDEMVGDDRLQEDGLVIRVS